MINSNELFALQQNAFYRFSFTKYKYKLLPIIFLSSSVSKFKILLPRDNQLDNATIKGISTVTGDATDLSRYFITKGYQVFSQLDMQLFTLTLMNESKIILQNMPLKRLSYNSTGNKFLATDFKFTTFQSYLIKTAPGNLSSNNMVCLLEFLYE